MNEHPFKINDDAVIHGAYIGLANALNVLSLAGNEDIHRRFRYLTIIATDRKGRHFFYTTSSVIPINPLPPTSAVNPSRSTSPFP